MNNPCPVKALNTRIPIVIPIKGRGFINHGSFRESGNLYWPSSRFSMGSVSIRASRLYMSDRRYVA